MNRDLQSIPVNFVVHCHVFSDKGNICCEQKITWQIKNRENIINAELARRANHSVHKHAIARRMLSLRSLDTIYKPLNATL